MTASSIRRAWAHFHVFYVRAQKVVTLGDAHSDPNCSHLLLASPDRSQIIELSGPVLDRVRWCVNCTPSRMPLPAGRQLSLPSPSAIARTK
jgi:hypothetical protein